MSDAAPAVAKSAPKKVAAKKVKKPAPSHPKYSVMIVEAIAALKERKGSSRQAIVKYIVANHKVDLKTAAVQVKPALKKGVISKELKQVKGIGASGSFKLNKPEGAKPKKSAAKAAKKPAAKKPVAKKAAKKPATKKSPKKVAKPKSVKKPAPAAKPKPAPAAAKPKPAPAAAKPKPATVAKPKPAAKKPAAKKAAKPMKTPTKKSSRNK